MNNLFESNHGKIPTGEKNRLFLEKLKNDVKGLLFKQDLTVVEAEKLTITLDKIILNLSGMSEEASDLAIDITAILSYNFTNKNEQFEKAIQSRIEELTKEHNDGEKFGETVLERRAKKEIGYCSIEDGGAICHICRALEELKNLKEGMK